MRTVIGFLASGQLLMFMVMSSREKVTKLKSYQGQGQTKKGG
jgi:hypothetical protein